MARKRAQGRAQGRAPGGHSGLRRGLLCGSLAALLVLGGCGGRVSGAVGRACMAADRDAANPSLCSCIQGVANQSLSAADQRRAAGFFEDPQEAQEVRASDRSSDDAFWQRYRAFVDRAEAICG